MCVSVFIYVYVCVCIYVYVYMSMYVYIMYANMYVSVYVCKYVWMRDCYRRCTFPRSRASRKLHYLASSLLELPLQLLRLPLMIMMVIIIMMKAFAIFFMLMIRSSIIVEYSKSLFPRDYHQQYPSGPFEVVVGPRHSRIRRPPAAY